MAGVGVDMIEIDRIERALERHPRLAQRLFWPRELEYARSRRRPGQHLAARFAAKEATLKALGVGGFGFRDVEVEGREGSEPRLRIHGRTAALAGPGVELRLSITHSRDIAAAVVIAERR